MYQTSSRMVAKLADDYYESVEQIFTAEDRENVSRIVELRQEIKAEASNIEQSLQNLISKIQQTSFNTSNRNTSE